ncbi:hypothetical protein CDAR_187521 [Caerostris darwini]|uniref:Uncharacterized protein n=1 Tax=Caerostris darwini TaxID=1538125 RepID=A0AAV4RFC6_9ARAC|nr:hypothetical protein CDAR_187521 [Caerostris darwini]
MTEKGIGHFVHLRIQDSLITDDDASTWAPGWVYSFTNDLHRLQAQGQVYRRRVDYTRDRNGVSSGAIVRGVRFLLTPVPIVPSIAYTSTQWSKDCSEFQVNLILLYRGANRRPVCGPL